MTPRGKGHPRVVLVTGASSGIGRAVAVGAAAKGDALVLVGRDAEALAVVADECRSRGSADVRAEAADVGDDDAVARFVAATVMHHGHLDAVVHSAGVVAYGRLEDVPAEVFDGVLRTNLLGAANVARHVLPVLREQEAGHLLLLGSVLGDIATPYMTAYAVSKWGIRALAASSPSRTATCPACTCPSYLRGAWTLPSMRARPTTWASRAGRHRR